MSPRSALYDASVTDTAPPRARDLGVAIGLLPPGPLNAIFRSTTYFAPEYDEPEWRKGLTERY